MKRRVLKIGRWVIDVLFAVRYYDIAGVVACLRDINSPRDVIDRSIEIMEECEDDKGFTFANPYLKRAVSVIGPSSSGEEFVNTLVHEIHHVAVAIASELGVDLEDETPAYLSGNAAMEFIDLICEFGCSKCHKKENRI